METESKVVFACRWGVGAGRKRMGPGCLRGMGF